MKRKKLNLKDRFEILRRDDFKCQLCGATKDEEKLEIDHKNPVSKGGDNSSKNLWTLCHPCNRGKGVSSLGNDFDGETLYEVNKRELEYKCANTNDKLILARFKVMTLEDELSDLIKMLVENEFLNGPVQIDTTT